MALNLDCNAHSVHDLQWGRIIRIFWGCVWGECPQIDPVILLNFILSLSLSSLFLLSLSLLPFSSDFSFFPFLSSLLLSLSSLSLSLITHLWARGRDQQSKNTNTYDAIRIMTPRRDASLITPFDVRTKASINAKMDTAK
jgi:hypothetical protein